MDATGAIGVRPVTSARRSLASRAQALLLCAALAGCAVCAFGCRATVVSPPNPSRPVTAYLIDYGRTSALALPAEAGNGAGAASNPEGQRLVRYAYGDWNWYALGRTDGWSAVMALLWPTTSAFGRGEITMAPAADSGELRRALGAEHIYTLTVSGERAALLCGQLDDMHAALGAVRPRAQAHGLEFVQHPRKYTYWHNSNHQTAAWLEALGCSVRGQRSFSNWRITSSGGHDEQ